MSINKAILVGYVGRDAEVRYLDNGTAVATFSLATSETYTAKSGEKVTNTEWHNIVAWRALGEMAGKYVLKGKQLYIEGQIRTRSYEQDSVKKYATEIVANTIQFLGRKDQNDGGGGVPLPDAANAPQQAQSQSTTTSAPKIENDDTGDDLPF